MAQAIKLKIKKGDTVIVTTGKSKGVIGTVLEVKRAPRGQSKILVEGANMIKKAVRPNPNVGEQGGIKEKEAFIAIANVKLFNEAEKKGSRVGYRILEDNKKVRYFKSTGELVEAE